jgi:ribonucleoside-triphosphate reductase (thioredoxin)
MTAHLPTPYQEFIHLARYSHWIEEKNRREFWPETVDRWCAFWDKYITENFPQVDKVTRQDMIGNVLRPAILNLEVMPSMRSLMTAGPALERDNMAGYNCSYLPIDDQHAFAEVMYILMCGTGVGFSVERQFIAKLPTVAEEFTRDSTVIEVADSRLGWATSFRQLVALLYSGTIPRWDVSKVRPKGARLKTFGGRASGPEPLEDLFRFTIALFLGAAGRKLTSIECHDLVCKIASVVVVGGVRRSALISLSNLSDDRMRNAKNGQWYETHKHRSLANNSAAYTEKPDFEVFLKEFVTLYESKAGERGVFSRVAAKVKAAENGRRDPEHDFGTNPCGEIILRPMGLCNLTEVVIRRDDTYEDLERKVGVAALIGTLQSALTKFRFVRAQWRKNAEEERLLGVSFTGIMDRKVDLTASELESLKQFAIDTNKHWAEVLGIPASAAITTVKPSGTVSQLVNSASGIHPRYAPHYIRRVVQDNKDPLTQFMIASGVPHQKSVSNDDQTVFEFPIASPLARIGKSLTARDQLEMYDMYRTHWCEHNPSTTIYYTDDDFLHVAQWVWQNFDRVGGVSFLPKDNGIYQQAPYEEIDYAEYEKRVAEFPVLDWEKLREYEKEDSTTSSHELACVGGSCEL